VGKWVPLSCALGIVKVIVMGVLNLNPKI